MQEEKQLANISNHIFDTWSLGLMNLPFPFDSWQCEQVGENNEGPYRLNYQKILIKESHEKLVNCGQYGLISTDYYLDVYLDGLPDNEKILLENLKRKLLYPFAWLRESVALRLQKVDRILRNHGFFIVIVSGWRDPEIQTISKSLMQEEFGKKYTSKAIAPVSLTSVSPHSTGGAFDIELWSLQINKPLSFSYPFDVINSFYYEYKKKLNKHEVSKRNIRRILFHLLTKSGYCLPPEELFVLHPGEFWHFGSGDPLSAYLSKENYAKYGYIKPLDGYKMHNHI